MPDKPISQLTASPTSMTSGDELAINRAGDNFKITAEQIAAGVLSINGRTIKDITFSGSNVTVTYTDNTSQTYTINNSGSSTNSGPFIKIVGADSKFIAELASANSLQDSDLLHLSRDGFDGKITLDQIKTYVVGQSTSSNSGSGLSIVRLETSGRTIITYSGTEPTISRNGSVMSINCDSDTLIRTVDATIQSPSDQDGDTSYSVKFIYPTDIAQTLPYDGSIDQCPLPILSISTVSSNKLEKSFEGMFVNNNSDGLTAVFADAFPIQGAKRRLSIIF